MTSEQEIHVLQNKKRMLEEDRARNWRSLEATDWELHRAKLELEKREKKNA